MIAGGYDIDAKDGDIRTHAGALTRRGVRIIACVEPDPQRRTAFQARWNVAHGYDHIDEMLAQHQDFDIACICTPSECHAADLDALFAARVKTVFCEKPLATNILDARRLVSAYRDAGRRLAVNYTRRWNAALRALAAEIANGRFGALAGATAWYGKGIVHNGSHMLDLLRMLIGDLRPVRAECLVDDGREDDPTVDALLLTRAGAPVQMIGTNYRQYDLFELQLRFAEAVVGLEDGGAILVVRFIEPDPSFSGHRRPSRGQRQDTCTSDTMLHAIDNVLANARHGESLMSDAASALTAQEIAAELVAMSRP